jgi:hypothetical protein
MRWNGYQNDQKERQRLKGADVRPTQQAASFIRSPPFARKTFFMVNDTRGKAVFGGRVGFATADRKAPGSGRLPEQLGYSGYQLMGCNAGTLTF